MFADTLISCKCSFKNVVCAVRYMSLLCGVKHFFTVQCDSYSIWCFRLKLVFSDLKELKEKEKKKYLRETLLCGNSQYAYL